MTKDKEPIDFFDAEGNRMTFDASAPLVMDWQRGSVPVGGDGCSAVSKATRPFEFRSPGNKREHMNEFNPDWNQMAVLVEQSQEQAAKIEQLEKQLAERSAEYLAAHITYDNGYEAGRQDEREECAKVCLDTEPFYGIMFANAIRARGNT